MCVRLSSLFPLFLYNITSTPLIYTLSLHDALPIYSVAEEKAQVRCKVIDVHASGQVIFEVSKAICKCECKLCNRVCRSEEHTSELQSPCNLVCRLLLEKKKKIK